MEKLAVVQEALDALELQCPSVQSLGKNQLAFTKEWQKREKTILQNFMKCIDVVRKNIEDTRANIHSIKRQDEAIAEKIDF